MYLGRQLCNFLYFAGVSDTVPPPVAQQVEVTSIPQTSTGTHESEMAPNSSQPHKKPNNNTPATANTSQTTTSHVESSDQSSSDRRSREPGASGDDEDPELTRYM